MDHAPSHPPPKTFAEAHRRAYSGEDMGRILALSDGVFAFALTLLVLQLTIPALHCSSMTTESSCTAYIWGVLNAELSAFYAYVLTFFIIGIWWVTHQRTFRFIRRYDALLVWTNLTFLLTIAVSPFVLGIYVAGTEAIPAVVIFSADQALAGLLLLAIFIHADRQHFLTAEADEVTIRYFRYRGVLIPAIFLVSIGFAFIEPVIATYCWIAAFVASALLQRLG